MTNNGTSYRKRGTGFHPGVDRRADQVPQWIGDKWAILFSHPKDFTPVCTTELGTVAKLKPEFDKRNIKAIGVSVDNVESHKKWIGDIEETQHTKLNFPILGDADKKVSKLYDMIHPGVERHVDGPLGIRDRQQQEDSPHADLPGEHGPQLSRKSCARSIRCN